MISFRKSAGPCRGIHTNQTSVSGPARLEHAGSRSKFTQARMKRLKTLKKIHPQKKNKRSSSRLRNLLLPVLHQDFCKKKRPQLHESSSCMDSWRHMTCIIVLQCGSFLLKVCIAKRLKLVSWKNKGKTTGHGSLNQQPLPNRNKTTRLRFA